MEAEIFDDYSEEYEDCYCSKENCLEVGGYVVSYSPQANQLAGYVACEEHLAEMVAMTHLEDGAKEISIDEL